MNFYAPTMKLTNDQYLNLIFLLKGDKTDIFTKTTGRPENTKKTVLSCSNR
jgi:hypothetical protein